ncbi:swarming motility protein SwrB [Siminovitchia terrae]|uniref:Swarming motility protein SwrB n=1 Tax=Siminovitchia terrae TaxID=1914933 RepID=A0ABQ4KRQ2_SIMTE|nr:hypothetical protein [Siminovitchia terrae]GIN94708.1 swarming motility protein SwrB [Siminovitchia terrae]
MTGGDEKVTGTLVFILFLINVLLAFALLLLYMRQNKLMGIEKRQQLVLKESEQVMASLLEEIKDENEKLLSRLMESRETEDKTTAAIAANIIMEEKKLVPATEEHQDVQEEARPLESKQDPLSDVSDDATDPQPLREQVKLLAEQGLTVTDIARKLNKGKTEIELLMKFR